MTKKISKRPLLGVALLGSLNVYSANYTATASSVTVNDLEKLGFNSALIFQRFLADYQIELDLWEKLKVSVEDEGKKIQFQTFDDLSIDVDIRNAVASWNKRSVRER